MKAAAQTAKLRHFELPRAVHLLVEGFTTDNKLLTQTRKLCRPAIRERFKDALDAMLLETEVDDEARVAAVTDIRGGGLLGELLAKALQSGDGALSAEDAERWDELRWDSISCMHNSNAIKLRFGLEVGVGGLLNSDGRLGEVLSLVRTAAAAADGIGGGGAGERRGLLSAADFAAECELPVFHVPSANVPNASEGRTVLVTGATGFLGAALLRELVERTVSAGEKAPATTFYCLVRVNDGGDDEAAHARLHESLESRLQLSAEVRALLSPPRPSEGSGARHRIVALAGDLAKPCLGLDEGTFTRTLGLSLDAIMHCGSQVNHVVDYTTLKPANVGASTSIARLCSIRSANSGQTTPPELCYVSTISVVGSTEGEDAVGSAESVRRKQSGYVQSKWVAEQRLRAAHARGICTLTIIRPPMIGPGTRTGTANASDWLMRFITGSILTGGYRTGTAKMLHLTPVDHAATQIAELWWESKAEESGAARVWHLPSTIRMASSELMEAVAGSSSLRARRRKIRELSALEWERTLASLPALNPLFPFRHKFAQGLGGIGHHEHRATSAALVVGGSTPPSLLRAYTAEEVELAVEHLVHTTSLARDASLLQRSLAI